MNNFKKQRINLFLIFLIYFSGSISLLAADNTIWAAGNNVYFKYAEQDGSGYGNNDHPANLEAEEIATVLASLEFNSKGQHKSEAELKSVFTLQQANLLGQYLAKGLKNATPNQDIIFVLERSVSRPLGLKADKYFVAGRAFYKDSKLNVIVGDYDRLRDAGYEAAVDPTHVGIVRYNFNHGSRSKQSKGFKKSIVTLNGIENTQINNTRRGDWLVIDINQAVETVNRKTSMRKQEEMAKKRQELEEILGTKEPAKVEKSSATEAPTLIKSKSAPQNTESSLPVNTARSLEKRLTTLKILRDKGLITDEEYTQKRKEILDDI